MGNDIDGNKIHPWAPTGEMVSIPIPKAEAQHPPRMTSVAVRLSRGEAVLERFCHCLEHILQRADSGENHGDVKNNSKKLSQRDICKMVGSVTNSRLGPAPTSSP